MPITAAMLRADKNAQVVILPWTLGRVFVGRYAIQSGKRIFDARWKRDAMELIRESQGREPVPVIQNGKRLLWYFHDGFFWDDDGLDADDIKALVLQRERNLDRKLQTARSLMRAEEARGALRASRSHLRFAGLCSSGTEAGAQSAAPTLISSTTTFSRCR